MKKKITLLMMALLAVLMIGLTALGDECEHEWQVKEPSCTEGGKRGCIKCGTVEDIPALGHKEETVAGKAATCTEAGKTEGKKCSRCGEVLSAQTDIPATGHTWQEGQLAPTCTKEGKRGCTTCGIVEPIAALGHKEEAVAGKAATCTEAGKTQGKKCSVCGAILAEQQDIPALGHAYKGNVVKPTTQSEGYTEHTCERCGDAYRDTYTAKLSSQGNTSSSSSSNKKSSSGKKKAVEEKSYVISVMDAERMSVGNASAVTTEATLASQTARANNTLVVTVAPEKGDELSSLVLSLDLLAQLKKDGIEQIRFVVGGAQLILPLSAFEADALSIVSEDAGAKAIGYVITVDPLPSSDAQAPGCRVNTAMQTADDQEYDVTELLDGVQLRIADAEFDVTMNTLYAANAK